MFSGVGFRLCVGFGFTKLIKGGLAVIGFNAKGTPKLSDPSGQEQFLHPRTLHYGLGPRYDKPTLC